MEKTDNQFSGNEDAIFPFDSIPADASVSGIYTHFSILSFIRLKIYAQLYGALFQHNYKSQGSLPLSGFKAFRPLTTIEAGEYAKKQSRNKVFLGFGAALARRHIQRKSGTNFFSKEKAAQVELPKQTKGGGIFVAVPTVAAATNAMKSFTVRSKQLHEIEYFLNGMVAYNEASEKEIKSFVSSANCVNLSAINHLLGDSLDVRNASMTLIPMTDTFDELPDHHTDFVLWSTRKSCLVMHTNYTDIDEETRYLKLVAVHLLKQEKELTPELKMIVTSIDDIIDSDIKHEVKCCWISKGEIKVGISSSLAEKLLQLRKSIDTHKPQPSEEAFITGLSQYGKKLSDKALAVMGYIVIKDGDWIVKKYADGSVEKLEQIAKPSISKETITIKSHNNKLEQIVKPPSLKKAKI